MATIPSPATAAVGGKETASGWNADVRDEALFWTTNRPLGQSVQTVAQTGWTTATFTSITFTTEDIDRDGQHSTSSNTSRYVIGTTLGWYRVSGVYCAAGNAAATLLRARIALNGTAVQGSPNSINPGGTSGILCVSTFAVFVQATASADFVEVQGYMAAPSGTIGTATSGEFVSALNVEWLGS